MISLIVVSKSMEHCVNTVKKTAEICSCKKSINKNEVNNYISRPLERSTNSPNLPVFGVVQTSLHSIYICWCCYLIIHK